jgi:hypothetical protein
MKCSLSFARALRSACDPRSGRWYPPDADLVPVRGRRLLLRVIVGKPEGEECRAELGSVGRSRARAWAGAMGPGVGPRLRSSAGARLSRLTPASGVGTSRRKRSTVRSKPRSRCRTTWNRPWYGRDTRASTGEGWWPAGRLEGPERSVSHAAPVVPLLPAQTRVQIAHAE